MGLRTFAALGVSLFMANEVYAVSRTQVVESSELTSTKISYKVEGRTKSKTIYCLKKVPGDAKSVSGGVLFTPVATTIAKMKAKKIRGTKLNAQIAIKKAGTSACTKLQNGTSPTPTPTPSQIGGGNFDGSGNTTPKGNTAFGIPSGITGNITSGKTTFSTYCSCHGSLSAKTFPYLRTRIAQDPMNFDSTQIPDSVLADVTAYLNRFSL